MQKRTWVGAMAVALLGACGGGAQQQESTMPDWQLAELNRAERDARANAAVNVKGIEGTLSNYDVRDTMERRGDEFAACHEPRANLLPVLAGQVEFGIQVHPDGTVGRVDIRASDLGDRVLERCLGQVILETKFPRPNGGEANVTYTMVLDSAEPDKEPEAWTSGRLGGLVEKREAPLRESCGVGAEQITVTAYVDATGRVVTAGVAAPESVPEGRFDCIAEGLRTWPMPKPKKRYAKVSFALNASGI